jgi:anti-sigma B factor antagonist
VTNEANVVVEPIETGLAVVHLSGRLDFTAAANTKQVFTDAVADGSRHLVVDLTNVGFIDSSGLSALVSGLRTTRQAGGDLRIAAAGPQAMTLFSLTSLDQVFRLYPTVEEGIRGFDE